MSYTPLRSIHRFSVFYRTSTATAAIGSDYPFQAITSVPASRALASYRPSAGALVLMNLMTTGVAWSSRQQEPLALSQAVTCIHLSERARATVRSLWGLQVGRVLFRSASTTVLK